MVPVAFVLEFFIVGKIARRLAFSVMKPDDRPQFITYAISICICCIMCPIMSLAATILFKETKTFGTWIQTWAMNFPGNKRGLKNLRYAPIDAYLRFFLLFLNIRFFVCIHSVAEYFSKNTEIQ